MRTCGTFLVVLCLARAVTAADITRYDSGDNEVAKYTANQLRMALGDMETGDRLELTPGLTYVPDGGWTQFDVKDKSDITINGGYTCRIRDVSTATDKLWYTGDDPPKGAPIIFHGATPAPLVEGRTYYVSHNQNNHWIKVEQVKGSGIHLDITSGVPANDICYGYHHAILVPKTSASHHALLNFNRAPDETEFCRNVTVQNITFDGQEKVSTGNGQLLKATKVAGTLNLYGIHVKNCRGHNASNVANGIDINACDEVDLESCFAENTGYCSFRTRNCGDVAYSFCRSINPLYRIIVDDTQSARTPFGTILLDSCVFKRTIPDVQLQQLGNTYTGLGNFNAKQAGRLASVTMDNCIVDWRDCEGAGSSWDWDAHSDYTVLVKFEGIKTLTIRDSQLRHGQNKGRGRSARTFKLDNVAVENIVIEGSTFSGAMYDNSTQTGARKSMTVKNSTFQADGNFETDYVCENFSYQKVYWQDVTVKHVRGGLFRLKNAWSTMKANADLDWNFEGLTATAMSTAAELPNSNHAVFFVIGPGYDEPGLNEMNAGLYHGIKRGFNTGPGIIDNQWNGQENDAEMQVNGTFFMRFGTVYSSGHLGSGISGDENYVGEAWVLYSVEPHPTRFPSAWDVADHYVLVRYDATHGWQWFHHGGTWINFTIAPTDILLYKATYVPDTNGNGDNEVSTSVPDHLPNTFKDNQFYKAGGPAVWKFNVTLGFADENYLNDD
jgi:hypothetical protein